MLYSIAKVRKLTKTLYLLIPFHSQTSAAELCI